MQGAASRTTRRESAESREYRGIVMNKLAAALAALGLAFVLGTGAASADDRPVLLELYTSQGCSSCPPADRLLQEIAGSEQVIAVALHVDYWDYLGWRDTFADPQFSRRQKAYAHATNSRTIYTPQFILHGTRVIAGFRPDEIARAIAELSMEPEPAELTATRRGNRLVVTLAPRGRDLPPSVLQLVRYRPSVRVDIERGENAGKSIIYANIVTQWRRVAQWNGGGALRLELPFAGAEPAVVILQAEGPGEVLAVRRVR